MNTKLFVGNLSFDTTEIDLQDIFAACGPVTDVNLITDRATGRSRGFAFVTMATPEGAQAAVSGAAGKNLKGRDIKVSEAREREDRKSTRLNSSHTVISYAVFCLKKKKKKTTPEH